MFIGNELASEKLLMNMVEYVAGMKMVTCSNRTVVQPGATVASVSC